MKMTAMSVLFQGGSVNVATETTRSRFIAGFAVLLRSGLRYIKKTEGLCPHQQAIKIIRASFNYVRGVSFTKRWS